MTAHPWYRTDDGWRHAPWWKRAINTVLRALQRGRPVAWLVYTRCTIDGDPPAVLGYGFGRIPMRPKP